MDIGDLAQWAAFIVLGAAFVMSLRRNGREIQKETKEDEREAAALKSSVAGIVTRLDDKGYGLAALNQGINDMKNHCAGITSGFSERISALEGKRRQRK